MPRRVTDYRGLTEGSRLKLLHAIQRRPGQTLKALAAAAEIHINTARGHLRVLEDEGFITATPVDTGRRGRPPMQYHPVDDVDHSPTARERAEEAGARGQLLRRISPELGHGQDLPDDALHQLDVLYEHLDDVGMEPVLDHAQLTVDVKPCLYQDLLAQDRPAVCSVHAKLVRQQLDQVDGPLKLRRLHPFTTAHSCLLVLGREDEQPAAKDAKAATPGIDGYRTDAELAEFALAAQQRAAAGTTHTECPV
ncbi:helix-turn-helix domain-containing protein [Enteractinococcus coprophilus]|uniref:Putative ArsR family transcriptional regulator n=1 Tax=Enteractinococcus coprophilus TaxID=1027633 RepID=A0A543ANL4_9MICC|nr:helix-turn-helix domain-containing protein [Enteractinococcus coprophilus]TQL74163.1 putative ArsR family transcriptional regulator [Enteractinococcus coprophilus]